MRFVISAKQLGGLGGQQRNIASTIRALASEHVDVCTHRKVPGPFLIEPTSGRVVPPLRWRRPSRTRPVLSQLWSLGFPLIRYRPGRYDAYLHFFGGQTLDQRFEAKVRCLIPRGDDIRSQLRHGDVVLLQAPSNIRLVGDDATTVLLPPPLYKESAWSQPVPGLPREFVLTVLNPHSAVKGYSVLAAAAHASPLPIIWCTSHHRQTGKVEHLPSVSNVITLWDLPQSQLRHLYETCVAYVSFSHDEGFGWAIADALQYGAPVISRRIGVLTLDALDLRSVHTYETTGELLTLLQTLPDSRVVRDLKQLHPDAFRAGLRDVVDRWS